MGMRQDAMVEYMNDGYDQDLLDEEGLEGEEYPEGLLEGRPCCLCQSPCQTPVAMEGVTESATTQHSGSGDDKLLENTRGSPYLAQLQGFGHAARLNNTHIGTPGVRGSREVLAAAVGGCYLRATSPHECHTMHPSGVQKLKSHTVTVLQQMTTTTGTRVLRDRCPEEVPAGEDAEPYEGTSLHGIIWMCT